MAAERWKPKWREQPRPYDDVYGPNDDVGSWSVAARWWEPRRIWYNALLLAVFAYLLSRTWSRIAPELSVPNVLRLLLLAALANLCYSTAYPADMALQTVCAPNRRAPWRWAIWVAGTLFAVVLEMYWYLDEILPPPT